MSSKQTVACFGATCGCVGGRFGLRTERKAPMHCLYDLRSEICGKRISSLLTPHHITSHHITVARTPDKLRNFLVKEHSISLGIIEQYLTIYQGDVKEPADVAKALVSPANDGLLVDVILSGVGAYPTFQWGVERKEGGSGEPGPEIGYFVSRRDVGQWTFDKVVAQDGWEGKCVYLTY